MNSQNFDDIRPYTDQEIPQAMLRMVHDPLIERVAQNLYPEKSVDELRQMLLAITTINEFQTQVMRHAICKILKNSDSSFSITGLEGLDPQKSYLFVSNHRDIMLDSAILQLGLVDHGFRTTEITFGSNLMNPEFVVDFGKSNKMFKVQREGTMRERLAASIHLSAYIRQTVTQKGESVWIAQRNGRTKDGLDLTDQGLIKMFSMSGLRSESILDRIRELNIVPIAISYQIEPCDALKAREIWLRRQGPYVKAPGEDLNSITTGITQPKGEIRISVLEPLNKTIDRCSDLQTNDTNRAIAGLIDYQIHKNYYLFDNNYLAWDLLHNSRRFADQGMYDQDALSTFVDMMESKLSKIDIPRSELEPIYLQIYANPVESFFSCES